MRFSGTPFWKGKRSVAFRRYGQLRNMTGLKKLSRVCAGLICLGAALAILQAAGLPQRSTFTGFIGTNGEYIAPELGAIAPPIDLLTWDYRPFWLAPNEAPVTIINFWATWCAPCRKEMALLQSLQEAHPESVRIVAVNAGESVSAVASWTRELRLGFDVLLDPSRLLVERYRVRGLPTTFVLDPQLRVRQIYYGVINQRQILGAIHSILNNP